MNEPTELSLEQRERIFREDAPPGTVFRRGQAKPSIAGSILAFFAMISITPRFNHTHT